MNRNPFNAARFMGYVNEVAPQKVSIHIPSAWLLSQFRIEGETFSGGNVGEYIAIEGERYGFVAKISSLKLPDSERKALSERAVNDEGSQFHPIAEAELLMSFKMTDPETVEKTAARFPEIGSRVYAVSAAYVQMVLSADNRRMGVTKKPAVQLGGLVSNGVLCTLSLNALFGRHCAVIGTTGSGKSHTVSKLLDALVSETGNKIVILDPTGEYSTFDDVVVESRVMGQTCHFPYRQLSVADLFYLLRPTAQSQRPILAQAIRSLKTVALARQQGDKTLDAYIDEQGCLKKMGMEKSAVRGFQYKNINAIEDESCSFDIKQLGFQIRAECVFESARDPATQREDPLRWGGFDARMNDYQASLKLRIQELLASNEFNALFNFKDDQPKTSISVVDLFKCFFADKDKRVLRLDFSQTSSSFSAREIVANAIAKFLYNQAKSKAYLKSPVVLILDEAHLFVNKRLLDADQNVIPLDAFDLIAKECRKFGLFLCLSTQMPRDIPVGTLSQMGAFVVHRLINEQDRRTVEMACSSASQSALAYLPALGPGEALITGVEFAMPLVVKVAMPRYRPNSATPQLAKSSVD